MFTASKPVRVPTYLPANPLLLLREVKHYYINIISIYLICFQLNVVITWSRTIPITPTCRPTSLCLTRTPNWKSGSWIITRNMCKAFAHLPRTLLIGQMIKEQCCHSGVIYYLHLLGRLVVAYSWDTGPKISMIASAL